jgi:DNA-binding MarR family transcriptional regulator
MEKKNLTDKHKLILDIVAKSRHQGIVQHKLGELLNMDPKTVFYYLKKLDQIGLM